MPSFSCGAARRRAERRFAPGMRAAFLGRAAQRARETQTKGPGGKPPLRPPLWPHGRLVKNRGKRVTILLFSIPSCQSPGDCDTIIRVEKKCVLFLNCRYGKRVCREVD